MRTATESCEDCIEWAADSPYAAASLAIVPRGGHTACVMGCRCYLERKSGSGFRILGEPPTPPKGLEERRPLGDAFEIEGDATGGAAEGIERARSALSSLFEADGIPDVPVRIEPLTGLYGKYEGGAISIAPDGPWPGFTALHEMGHAVDAAKSASASVLPENFDMFDELDRAIEQSYAYGVLKIQRDALADDPEDVREIVYLMRREELFARIFAQFVAEESGDERLLGELERCRDETKHKTPRQWETWDFHPIRLAIRILLARLLLAT